MKKIILVNLAILLAGLVVIELVFGSWFSSDNLGALNISTNVTRIKKDNPYYPEGSVVLYKRDRYGMRGAITSYADINILAVGGSTTNDRVSGEGDSWTDVLQSKLIEAGKPAVVANAGVDGHSTIAHIKSFQEWFPKIPDLKPEWVLMYVGVNDRVVVDGKAEAWDMVEHSDSSRRFRTYVSNNSILIRLFKIIRGTMRANQAGVAYGDLAGGIGPKSWEEVSMPENLKTDYEERLSQYRQRLEILNRQILEFGAKPIWVTQPIGEGRLTGNQLFQVVGSNGGAAYASMALFNEVLMDFCRDTDGVCIDLANELTFEDPDFYDLVHTTPAGSRKIGEFLAQRLANML